MITKQNISFEKAKEEFFAKSNNLSQEVELILFLSFLKQVSLSPSVGAKKQISKAIENNVLTEGAKKLFAELYITENINEFISINQLKLETKTRYFQKTVGELILSNIDFNMADNIFLKYNKSINLEPAISNLIINFLRNHERINDETTIKTKELILKLLDKYKSRVSGEELDKFLHNLCVKTRNEMKGKEGKRNRIKETLEFISYLSPNYLNTNADVFISGGPVVYTKAHLATLLETNFSNNKEALYKFLWVYLGRNLNYTSQISVIVEKLKGEPNFLEKLSVYKPFKTTIKKETMITIEKMALSTQLQHSIPSEKKKLKI